MLTLRVKPLWLSLGIVSLLAHANAQQCAQNEPASGSEPPELIGGQCEIGQVTDPLTAPQIISMWPQTTADVSGDPLRVGIPFYVEARDQDRYIQRCDWGDRREAELASNDVIDYEYTVDQGDLPAPGSFVGAGRSELIWNYPAAVYLPPQGLDDGDYEFRIRCRLRQASGPCEHTDAGGDLLIEWQVTLTVENCEGSLELMLVPPTPPPPPGPLTLEQGLCCVAAPQWWIGENIQPTGNNVLPRLVEVDQYVVLAAEHLDTDLLVRSCDDNQAATCPDPTGVRQDFLDCQDACRYMWTARNLSSGSNGVFASTAHEFAVIWRPTEPGIYEICLTVDNWPGQAQDQPRVSYPFPHLILVPDRIALIESKPAFEDWRTLAFCDQIALWVNDDDDNRDGLADNAQVLATANENDLHALRLSNLTGLPSELLEVRFRVDGESDSLNLFISPDRAAEYPTSSPPWVPFFNGLTLYLEGAKSHAQLNDAQLLVDVRVPGTSEDQAALIRLDVTVFGVHYIRHYSDFAPDGKAVVTPWSLLHPLERPAGFEVEQWADNAFFYDPGADPQIDTPTGANYTWSNCRRHLVASEVVVTPTKAGVAVYVAAMDVDDNSYRLWGSAPHQRKFLDRFDWSANDARARFDNNDKTSVVVNGQGTSSGGVQPFNTWPQAPQTHLALQTIVVHGEAVAGFEFVSTLAPGDNFRIVASLAPDMLPSTSSSSGALLAKIPQDYGSANQFSVEAEREADIIFRRVLGDAEQSDALSVPRAPADPVAGDQGHHTLSGPLLTVRRRIHLEILEQTGTPPQTWNFECDPALENASAPMTRYVYRIEGVGAGGPPYPHREYELDGKNRHSSQPQVSLRRRNQVEVFDTLGTTRPFPFLGMLDCDHDFTGNYGGPRYLAGGTVPIGFPGQIEGPFSTGVLALQAGDPWLAGIALNGEFHAYAVHHRNVPFEILFNNTWISSPEWSFTEMRPNAWGTELLFPAPISTPVPLGATLRVGVGGSAPGIPGIANVIGTLSTGLAVGPDTDGLPFRFPVLVYDDTSWERGNLPAFRNPFDIQAERSDLPGQHSITNSMLRDTCIALRPLSVPYRRSDWGFHKHVPVAKMEGDVFKSRGIFQSLLKDSRLLEEFKISQERCWINTVLMVSDGHAGSTYEPHAHYTNNDPKDETCVHEPGAVSFVVRAQCDVQKPAHLLAGAGEKNIGLISIFDWVVYDALVSQVGKVTALQPVNAHGYAGMNNMEYVLSKIAVHEVLHQILPWPLATSDDEGWSLYGLYLNDPEDDHELPGLLTPTLQLDPVVGGPLEGAEDLGGGVVPPQVSPYVVRYAKESLLAVFKERR